MLPMMWKRAEGTRPGRSLTTLRNLRRRLLRPSSSASSSSFPTVTSSKSYRCIQRCSSERSKSGLSSGLNR